VRIDSTAARNGCSPGFWKNHLELWPVGRSGDDFDVTFGVNLFDPDVTLGAAINLTGGYPNDLARHGTAALLSAEDTRVNYPYSADAVKALVRAGDPDGRLAAANALGCPL